MCKSSAPTICIDANTTAAALLLHTIALCGTTGESPRETRESRSGREDGYKCLQSYAYQETLNAKSHYGSSEDDGGAVHRINQYSIKQEIGRGSFGSVHLGVDQYGQEYVGYPSMDTSYPRADPVIRLSKSSPSRDCASAPSLTCFGGPRREQDRGSYRQAQEASIRHCIDTSPATD